jgi:ribosome-associated protein
MEMTPCFLCGGGGTHIQRYRRLFVSCYYIRHVAGVVRFASVFYQTGQLSMDLSIRGEPVTLAQALKIANVAGTGGQAKYMIREGMVTVNGQSEIRPGRKLADSDTFQVERGGSWTIRMSG